MVQASLYDLTGDIKDINTILVPKQSLEAAEKDAARLNWLLTYFVSDDTGKDDEIIAASEIGVDQIKTVIDAAMKEQK